MLVLILIALLLIVVVLQIVILVRLKKIHVPLPLSVPEKFAVLTESLNRSSFGGKAQTRMIDQRSFELLDETDPGTEIVQFRYRGGTLKVSWTVGGRMNEPLFSTEYLNLEQITTEQQEKLAGRLVAERRA